MMRSARVALFAVALCGIARADGVVVPGKAVVTPARTPDQRALMRFDGASETLVIETTLQGEGRDFAWILPLPAAPRIEASTTGLFPTLEAVCAPEVIEDDRDGAAGAALLVVALGVGVWTTIRWWRRPLPPIVALAVTPVLVLATGICLVGGLTCGSHKGMMAGPSGAPSAVTVLAREQVGAFDTATLDVRDPAALRAWLDANGFRAAATVDSVVADYVREEWVFIASKIRRDADDGEVRRVHSLAFTFAAKQAVYPMRLTGAANDSVALELFVVGDTRAEATGLAVEHCDRFHVDSDGGHAELRRRAAGADVLTKLTGTLDRAAMKRDIAVRWVDFEPLRPILVTSRVALRRALVPGAWTFAGLLVVGAILRRRRADPAFLARGDAAWWAGTAALAAGVVGAAWIDAPRLPAGARVASGRMREASKLRAPPESVRGDAAAVRVWAADTTRGVVNEWTGEPVREDDSPGNWTVRETDGRTELVLYEGAGERTLDVSRRIAVEGVVRSADGRPVSDATVSFQTVGFYRPDLGRPESKTDGLGRFRLDVPNGRKWEIVVVHPDHPDLWGTQIDVRGATAPLTLGLPPERPLRGRLLDAEGRPLAGATVGVFQDSPRDMRGQRLATTAADGAFEFRGFDARLAAIEVTVHVHHEAKCDGKPSWDVVLKPDSPPVELRIPR